jgi:hypothetical protein
MGVLSVLGSRLKVITRATHARAHMQMSSESPVSEHPTELAPKVGRVAVGDVILSEAEHFIGDDGVHTVRSVEFDVAAHADDFEAAVDMFVVNTEDYCSYLAKLAQKKTASPQELETLGLLADRVVAVGRERERESQDLVSTLLRKLTRQNSPTAAWLPPTTPMNSSEPSAG